MHRWGDLANDVLADIARRRNIDPTTVPVDPPPFDPAQHRVEQAQLALSAMVPHRFHAATVDHPKARAWVEAFLADPRGVRSLLLAGTPGTGKTHLGYAMLRYTVLYAAANGPRISYQAVTHPDLNQQLRPSTDNSHEHALDTYLDVDLLLFDDLGTGRQTDWTADNLHRLVDHRWSENLATIYTTNIGTTALKDLLGDRIVSRILDTDRIMLGGPDRRAE